MVVYEKYLGAYMNNQHICLKNNTVQLYSIKGRVKLRWIFFGLLWDASDSYKFPSVHMVRVKSENIRTILRFTENLSM